MKIAVYGSAAGEIRPDISEKVKEIGRQIAQKGHTLITGGCLGYPYDAVLGAAEFDGQCIAYSPATNMDDHLGKYAHPQEGFTDFVFVPKEYIHADNMFVCKKYRNVSSVADTDIAIFVSGRTGTLNEFTNAYDFGKTIGVLEGSGGITTEVLPALLRTTDKQTSSQIIFEQDPVLLVEKLINDQK